ncbi:MAG: beta-galactosidase small subunit, partial [Planctomycetota bacterium]
QKDWGAWNNSSRDLKVSNVSVSQDASGIRVRFAYKLAELKDVSLTCTYQVKPNGVVDVTMTSSAGKKEKPLLPRFGMKFGTAQEFSNVLWYGRGPHETYVDRRTGGEIAKYRFKVDQMWHAYCRTQDTGNRSDCRWFSLTNDAGEGLKVTAINQPINFSALPFTLDDLAAANHPHELPRRETNTIFVDHQLHGVGGDNSWGARTHKEYTLPLNKPYTLKFTLESVDLD